MSLAENGTLITKNENVSVKNINLANLMKNIKPKLFDVVKKFDLISNAEEFSNIITLQSGGKLTPPVDIIFSNSFTKHTLGYEVSEISTCASVKAICDIDQKKIADFYVIWDETFSYFMIDFNGNRGHWGQYRSGFFFNVMKEFKTCNNKLFCRNFSLTVGSM